MPAATTARDVGWLGLWVAVIAFVHVGMLGAASVQFLVQFALSAIPVVLPGLLAWNLVARKPSRVPLRWQLVILLWIASALAAHPWNSVSLGCPDC